MRPRGEFRSVIAEALGPDPLPCRDLAARTCVSVDVARHTLDNMRRADPPEVDVTYVRLDGVKRPVPAYSAPASRAPAAAEATASHAAKQLQSAVGLWWVDDLVMSCT